MDGRTFFKRILIILIALACTFVLSLVMRTSSTYTVEFGFEVPESQDKTVYELKFEEPTDTRQSHSYTEFDQYVLDYIDGAYDASRDTRTLFEEEKMIDYLEDNFFMNDLFCVSWDGDKDDSSRAYTVDADGSTYLVKTAWSKADYIRTASNGLPDGPIIATVNDQWYLPVRDGTITTPRGNVYQYRLYPLKDCYLSYIGSIKTKYNPKKIESFMHTVELFEYIYNDIPESLD